MGVILLSRAWAVRFFVFWCNGMCPKVKEAPDGERFMAVAKASSKSNSASSVLAEPNLFGALFFLRLARSGISLLRFAVAENDLKRTLNSCCRPCFHVLSRFGVLLSTAK